MMNIDLDSSFWMGDSFFWVDQGAEDDYCIGLPGFLVFFSTK